MLFRSLGRLASIVLASVATGAAATLAVTTLTAPVSAQDSGGLSSVDCSVISSTELELAVLTTVAQLRALGYSDRLLVSEIGAQLKVASSGCSGAQQMALLSNVVAILDDSNLSIASSTIVAELEAGYGPVSNTAVAELVVEELPSVTSVY